jgi:hypothetical protein
MDAQNPFLTSLPAGKIEDLQRQMRKAVAEPDHIEASICIFKPDIDLHEVMA